MSLNHHVALLVANRNAVLLITCISAAVQVGLHPDVPVGLHGGPLLGVAMKRGTSVGSELSGEEAAPVLQFYSWDGRTQVCMHSNNQESAKT